MLDFEGSCSNPEAAEHVLATPDHDTLPILHQAWQLRRRHFGDIVKVNALANARSGGCGEDCHYCAQSTANAAPASRPKRASVQGLLAQARLAQAAGARRFCMSVAGRTASEADLARLCEASRLIRQELGLELCVTLGLMTGNAGRSKLARLKAAGINSYNHNLNTHRDLYGRICTTHSYQDRLETLRNARSAGLETCSGIIVGLGETDRQLAELAFTLRDEGAHSIPINFLIPVPGTKLGDGATVLGLSPWKCLRILSMFRLVNPAADIRASAGREHHLRSLQPLALLPANSLFLGGYLTQAQRDANEDWQMIADLGMSGVANSWSAGASEESLQDSIGRESR